MYGFGEGATELYIASGSSDDWAHLSGIMLSYTVELRDTGQYAFLLPEEQIEPMCAENMEGLRAIYEYIQPKPACNLYAAVILPGTISNAGKGEQK